MPVFATVDDVASVMGPPITNAIVNLGTSRSSGSFDLVGLTGLTSLTPVRIWQTAAPVPSKGDARDEIEFTAIRATGYVLDATTVRVHWLADGVAVGDYSFSYRTD